ncbi:hypothetical protein [Ramlibacter tataouinensis]|uniref:Uncharacterized protein n=1 Tax=Ramlibacter tataouinensis (strain ATCC BAA-407 / DSM 14655 / LMG 21543 / TTB310) TaxID=365046 RepID=F5Y461_RAMTT|nr:hypothetical protein [Ramlibacter tataouinensis]AEG92526.1 hypothetical protein Rta_14350 [Ramlibacter tataouinensis TTB310]
MNLDDRLAAAFDAWVSARAQLGNLRGTFASQVGGGQLGASPEAAHLGAQIGAQEAQCQKLFEELAALAEQRAAEREAQWLNQATRPPAD